MPSEAAYGRAHQRLRERLMKPAPTGELGLPCPRCGQPMVGAGDPDPRLRDLDLGHSDPAFKRQGLPGDRLEHAHCNRGFGDGSKVWRPEHSNVAW